MRQTSIMAGMLLAGTTLAGWSIAEEVSTARLERALAGVGAAFGEVRVDPLRGRVEVPELRIGGQGGFELQATRVSAQGVSPRGLALTLPLAGDSIAALEAFSARSIDLPEVRLSATIGRAKVEYLYRDVVATRIERGRIAELKAAGGTARVEGAEPGASGTVEFGPVTIAGLDLLAFHRAYAGTAGADAPFANASTRSSYENLRGTLADGTTFTLARYSDEGVALKPGTVSLLELAAAVPSPKNEPDAKLSPEETDRVFATMADVFGRMRAERVEMTGLAVKPANAPASRIARIGVERAGEGRIGGFAIEGFEMSDPAQGSFKLAALQLRDLSFVGVGEALRRMTRNPDAEPDPAVIRDAIPELGSLSLTGVELASPEVTASLGRFELALSERVSGVATAVRSRLDNFVVPMTAELGEGAAQLRALGIEKLDFGYTIDAAWRPQGRDYDLRDFTLGVAGVGSIGITGQVGNVSEQAFSADLAVMMPAWQNTVLKTLRLRVENGGLFDRFIEQVAREQGSTPAEVRVALGEQADALLQLLGSARLAETAAPAIAEFLAAPKSLTLAADPAEPVAMAELVAAAQADPLTLVDPLNVTLRAND